MGASNTLPNRLSFPFQPPNIPPLPVTSFLILRYLEIKVRNDRLQASRSIGRSSSADIRGALTIQSIITPIIVEVIISHLSGVLRLIISFEPSSSHTLFNCLNSLRSLLAPYSKPGKTAQLESSFLQAPAKPTGACSYPNTLIRQPSG